MKEKRVCTKCLLDLNADQFSKRSASADGINTRCKACISEIKKQYRVKNLYEQRYKDRRRRARLRDKINAKQRANYWKNPEKAKSRSKYYRDNNKGRILARNKIYYREKLSSDPRFKLRRSFWKMLRRTTQASGVKKKGPTIRCLGYGVEKLKNRLEFNFSPGMSWDNYGTAWNIDHKIPLSKFFGRCEYRPHVVNALSNLQPMWVKENCAKGAKSHAEFLGLNQYK